MGNKGNTGGMNMRIQEIKRKENQKDCELVIMGENQSDGQSLEPKVPQDSIDPLTMGEEREAVKWIVES